MGLFKDDSPAPTASSTPVAARAPTPLSTSFVKDSGSNHATPTSASSAGRTAVLGNGKKNKKAPGDDSEGERDAKKIRTNFGAQKK